MAAFVSLWLGTALFAATAATPTGPGHVMEHRGMCDASAAIALGSDLFIVANDEDNVLRVYSSKESGDPIQAFDLSEFLKADAEHPEADIEGATRIGNRIYWITSHGANKNAKPRPGRRRFFATDVAVTDGTVSLVPVEKPYEGLVEALTRDTELDSWKLAEAAKKAPEATGGLNIEGLTAAPDGTLLIGFRNPMVDDKVLVVALNNPEAIINGQPATLGKPISLSLGKRGIRSIEYSKSQQQYLIIAGPSGDVGAFSLYRWSGVPAEAPQMVEAITFTDLQPEALVVDPDGGGRLLVLSDDGGRQVDGHDCKDANSNRRTFRSVWITP